MKIKDIFNLENVKSFIEGNAKYYYEKLQPEPQYIREQRLYRLSICADDCVVDNKCIKCSCPTEKKIFVDKSCNIERFYDIMSEEAWEAFKKHNDYE